MIEAMRELPEHLRRSITWDRGSEMANWKQILLELDAPVYFCDPHSPWQRGSNENTNRLLRFWFEKGTDLSGYTKADLRRIEDTLNRGPDPRSTSTPQPSDWQHSSTRQPDRCCTNHLTLRRVVSRWPDISAPIRVRAAPQPAAGPAGTAAEARRMAGSEPMTDARCTETEGGRRVEIDAERNRPPTPASGRGCARLAAGSTSTLRLQLNVTTFRR